MEREFGIKLRFKGEQHDIDRLDLYDGSDSFHGFARALSIVVHAYLNDEVTGRATALKGGSLSFGAPRRGSVLFDLVAKFARSPKSAPVSADTFYDFTKVALARATGDLDASAQTSFVQKKLSADEPFFDELGEALEGSLQHAHRSIDNEDVVVSLERPRAPLLLFDKSTSAWVNTRDENPTPQEFRGNMTRFNTQTGNGRAYIKSIRRIVPVRKSDGFVDGSKSWLTWSLHGSHLSTDKDLVFSGRKIVSATGETKRILIDNCWKA
ncbi:hypothetical protein [Sphingomonas sp.]|uniref:DUF7946 domain-containing protein n=1 Tax=Sphingomonas sp. TaxID=28214 RepID=UPI002896D8B7|nr:hypothetical protein [Sphingomonas sp.]